MKEQKDYYNYLLKRSALGYNYRKYFLYPKLNKYVEGLVLDLGCGIGDYLENSPKAIGIDINPFLVDLCKKKGLNVKKMEVDQIPFEDDYFDSILIDNVLEHIENPRNILIEASRVLKNNGTLLIGVPGLKGYKRDSDHKVFYDKNKLISTINQYGYNLIKYFYTPINIKVFSRVISQNCLYCIFKSHKDQT